MCDNSICNSIFHGYISKTRNVKEIHNVKTCPCDICIDLRKVVSKFNIIKDKLNNQNF